MLIVFCWKSSMFTLLKLDTKINDYKYLNGTKKNKQNINNCE